MGLAGRTPTVVCVLGMARTGTSLTTRVLSLAGVYLGPDEELLQKDLHQLAGEGASVLARAKETNPEGFWEHYRLMRLNERILKSLGGSWRDPPSMAPGWEASERLDAERDEARELLRETFGGRDLWAWKDPRNCFTLPFWQRLLPDMRYVICLRNPVDVAASLERRDGMPREEAMELWLAYVACALVNTSGRPRLLVPYESHFDDPHGTAARLARFVGRAGALDGPRADRLLAGAVDNRLWRNRTSARDVIGAHVSQGAASLHLITQLLATVAACRGGDGGGDLASLETAADQYADAFYPRQK